MDIARKIYSKFWQKEAFSTASLLAHKLFCKVAGGIYGIKFSKELRSTESFLKEKRKETAHKSVFVFANGPSLKDIDLKKISVLQENNHDIIVVNSFVSNSAAEIKPDHVVFADKIHFGLKKTENKQYAKDLSWCIEENVNIYIPAHYSKIVKAKKKFAFNALSNIHSKNTTDITKPLGYYPLTALYALSLAKSLGYKNIYMAGFDNSYFKDFQVTDENNLVVHHKHYYDNDGKDTNVKKSWSPTSEVFFDFYRHFLYIEKITRDDPRFYNVSKETYLNTIKRKTDLDIYKTMPG